MDGDKIEIGDSVYDFLLKTGQVISVNLDGTFTVKFGPRTMTYSPGGEYQGVRRLYWRDPILLTPQKTDRKQWTIIRNMIVFMYKELTS